NELHVTRQTPPTLLVLAGDDKVVKPANSFAFMKALQRNAVPASLHLYAKGDHGFLKEPPFEEWFGRVLYWMKEMDYAATSHE
ncbi:MAG: prolyl oligopeptidase family serine peptidase, partial [Niabella sp.]|nr:prolyl oligopeptidase family serine peptidase [Niabella sp.]